MHVSKGDKIPYRWVDHTAELELEIDAPTAGEVFVQAALALGELLGDEAQPGAERRTIEAEAPDRPALLAAFVEELVFLAESEQLVPVGVHEVDLGDAALRASVELARGRPPHLVKAVTYHRLSFERQGERYRATAVLDV